MKTIASIVLATLSFTAIPSVQAHDHTIVISVNRPVLPHITVSAPVLPHITVCAPIVPQIVYTKEFVCTKELYRTVESRVAYNEFGDGYTYNVMVVTYADYYSDGSSRSYTRSYRV